MPHSASARSSWGSNAALAGAAAGIAGAAGDVSLIILYTLSMLIIRADDQALLEVNQTCNTLPLAGTTLPMNECPHLTRMKSRATLPLLRLLLEVQESAQLR